MRRDSCRGGFTLLELLLAAGLTAVLMACVLSVLTTLARDRRRASGPGADASGSATAVLDLIRLDLVHARQMSGDAAGARQTMTGPLAIDPARLTPTGRAAEVTYEVVAPPDVDASRPARPDGTAPAQGGGWLVRRQRMLDDPRATGATWSELVAPGVASLTLAPEPGSAVPGTTADGDRRPVRNAGGNAAGASPLSGRVRVRLTWRDSKRPPIDAVVVTW